MERIPGGTKPRRGSAESLAGAMGVKGGGLAIYTAWRKTNATSITESSGLPLKEAGENFQPRSDSLAPPVNGGTSCNTLIFPTSPPAPIETLKATTPSAVVWKGKGTSAADKTAAGL